MDHIITGREFIDVLRNYSKIDWCRVSPFFSKDKVYTSDKQASYPPYLVWRLTSIYPNFSQWIVDFVNNNSASIEWSIVFTGKTWYLTPSVVEKIYYDGKYRHINEVQVWFAKERPKFGKLANEELFKLSSKLDLYLKTQVKESKGSIPF